MLTVLVAPRAVFVALRETDQDDLDARQEPVLALILLCGVGAVLGTSTAATLADRWEYDAAMIAIWSFIAGSIYGMSGYFIIGGALYLGARALGGLGDYRRARHVVAFAATPLALSLLTLRPAELLAFGGDAFRTGGSDEGAAGDLFTAAEVGFGLWAGALLLIGTRAVHGWTWTRAVGALGLVALFVAAFAYLPAVLPG